MGGQGLNHFSEAVAPKCLRSDTSGGRPLPGVGVGRVVELLQGDSVFVGLELLPSLIALSIFSS